ncbi:MAG: ribonuclease HII, partial [Flavobacteriia bacterium]|nr:ribonuclease HII [Flavobacteriia bacterium]
GYPTVSHRKAIQEFGPCEHHRQTFNLLGSEQLTLLFD